MLWLLVNVLGWKLEEEEADESLPLRDRSTLALGVGILLFPVAPLVPPPAPPLLLGEVPRVNAD